MSNRAGTILERWQVTAEEMTEIVDANPSLRGMILGYLVEVKLRYLWFTRPQIQDLKKYDDHDRAKKGDLVVTYKAQRFIIEAKSLQTNTVQREGNVWTGKVQCDASDRRKITLPNGSKIETTCLLVGEFDLLAVNLFAFENQWRFIFAKNKDLPKSQFQKYTRTQRKYLLATLIDVSWPPKPPFREEPYSLLDEMIQERMR